MKRWIILAFLSVSALAQLATQEATPIPVQSANAAADSLAFPANVVSGHELIVAYGCFTGTSCLTGPSIADTLTTTWTSRVTQGSTTCGNLWIWTGQATSSGADTVTVTNISSSFKNIQIHEFANVSNTLDVASTATQWSSSPFNTPSVTTTANGSLLFASAMSCSSGFNAPTGSTLPLNSNSSADSQSSGWKIAGVNGSYNLSFKSGGGASNSAIIAMKAATAVQVVTTKIPDAVSGTAYSFDLHANGGSGAYTWTQTAGTLPTGLSLSSGGVISGTPTAGNADQNMTFHVVDGAAASANSPSLTLHVGTSFNTITAVQTHTSVCGASLGTVTSGNLILVNYSVAGKGVIKLTDSLSTVYSQLPVAFELAQNSGGNDNQQFIAWGFPTSTGADTLACSGIGVANSAASEFSNVQKTFDPAAAVITLAATASPYTSGSMTSPVAETLFSWMSPNTSTAAVTTQSPYTAGVTTTANSIQTTAEYQIGAASGSHTASYVVTSNTDANWGIALFGLRASSTGTAPASGNCAACELSMLDVGQGIFADGD